MINDDESCFSADEEKAFFVEDVPYYDVNSAPSNGHEYLKQVINEAEKCPQTVVAQVDRKLFNSKQTVWVKEDQKVETRREYLPTNEWEVDQVAHFSELRMTINRRRGQVPRKEDVASSQSINFFKNLKDPAELINKKPSAGDLIFLGQPTVLSNLRLISECLIDEEIQFSNELGVWVYSYLAVLDEPLEPDDCHLLRELARFLIKQRPKIDDLDDPLLNSVNVLICLICRYFRQMDLLELIE